jgi:hypothetical protein
MLTILIFISNTRLEWNGIKWNGGEDGCKVLIWLAISQPDWPWLAIQTRRQEQYGLNQEPDVIVFSFELHSLTWL